MSNQQIGSELSARQAWLHRAQLLADSLERAIQAIAENSAESLECELREQTRQCAELAAMSERAAHAVEGRGAPAAFAELPEDRGRVCRHLRVLTDRYEAVLDHSGRTLRMLGALNQEANINQKHAGQPGESVTRRSSWLA